MGLTSVEGLCGRWNNQLTPSPMFTYLNIAGFKKEPSSCISDLVNMWVGTDKPNNYCTSHPSPVVKQGLFLYLLRSVLLVFALSLKTWIIMESNMELYKKVHCIINTAPWPFLVS